MTLQPIIDEAESHKAAAMIACTWVMREVPVAWRWVRGSFWPTLVAIYPYCRDNGGVTQIVKNFFVGKPKT